jgi:hypothetical protein
MQTRAVIAGRHIDTARDLNTASGNLKTDVKVLVSNFHAIDVLDGIQSPLGVGHVHKPHSSAFAGVLFLQHFHAHY